MTGLDLLAMNMAVVPYVVKRNRSACWSRSIYKNNSQQSPTNGKRSSNCEDFILCKQSGTEEADVAAVEEERT
jgi:hypothetical protein